jgi:hypothetical protein
MVSCISSQLLTLLLIENTLFDQMTYDFFVLFSHVLMDYAAYVLPSSIMLYALYPRNMVFD